jgi:hypothetical protein
MSDPAHPHDTSQADEILNGQVIYLKRGRLNKFGFEPAWNSYFDLYLSTKYLEKPILQLEDVTFHLWLRKNLNDADPTWQMPSIRVMKRKFGIGQNKIEAMLDRLTKACLLKKVSGQGSGDKGANVTNTYELSDPIQDIDDFLLVAREGKFPHPLKAEWQHHQAPPLYPKQVQGAVPEISTPPVPKMGRHKHTSSIKQTTRTMKENNNNSGGDQKQDVVVALVQLRITKRVAQRLASRHKEALIYQQIDYHQFDLATKPNDPNITPGRLRRRIEEDWAAPDGYTPDWRDRQAAEKAATEQAQAAAKQREEEQERLANERKAQEAARDLEREEQRRKMVETLRDAYQPVKETVAQMDQLWPQVLADLKPRGDALAIYLAGSELIHLTNDQAVIAVQNDYAREWLEGRLAGIVGEVLAKRLDGRKPALEFITLQ